MSSLTELTIHHLRNIRNVRLSLHPTCNLFYGLMVVEKLVAGGYLSIKFRSFISHP